jgi:hypothetical protein
VKFLYNLFYNMYMKYPYNTIFILSVMCRGLNIYDPLRCSLFLCNYIRCLVMLHIVNSYYYEFTYLFLIIIVLKPGPAGRPGTRPIRSWNWAGLKKKRGKKKPGVTRLTQRVDPETRLTQSRPGDFCFF